MWASLETWQLGDGSVAELGVGDVLPMAGIRANCERLAVAASSSPVGVTPIESDGSGLHRYRLSGVCRVALAPQIALVDCFGMSVLAEPADFRPAAGSSEAGAVERYSPDFTLPRVGQLVEADCRLEVVADYEWEAFELPDARRDWLIAGIRLVRHDVVPAHGRGAGARSRGVVVTVETHERLHRSADAHVGNVYLVDLTLP